MLSLYRAWLGPSPCVARPVPPPGAHRPVPRRPKPPTPPPASPSSTTSSELLIDVERIETLTEIKNKRTTSEKQKEKQVNDTTVTIKNGGNNYHNFTPASNTNAVIDVASCDGPVRFSRVLNTAWKESDEAWCRHRKRSTVHYYPCKTCGCRFPSYYFVHKHRKRCHGEEEKEPEPSTSAAAT